MNARSHVRVSHWFADSEERNERDVPAAELEAYLRSLRIMKSFSAALRVAVEDSEIDLGVQPKHVW
ncbi:MAG TPA: hypothetical protein VNL92_05865 [Dehalococcoidia bacterium]|nr:hypothetical protein [Dehalococcoidia bacterium]